MEKTQLTLAAIIVLRLQELSNIEFAVLSNAVQLSRWVSPQTLIFEKARRMLLIKDDGSLCSFYAMRIACLREASRRVEAGTFGQYLLAREQD